MQPFNSAFFSLYESLFSVYSDIHGSRQALQFMEKLFAKALGKAYLASGFTKGNINDFARIIKERDESVGLPVTVTLATPQKIIYQFHQDPFPNLKNLISWQELDRTYINFKVKFLLGDQWTYSTSQHIWDGHPFTEHVIFHQQ